MTEHTFPPPLDRSYPVVDGKIVTRSLEAHVVDHCNLTCAECCSLSPHLPHWQVEAAALARDLALATRILVPRVFKLVGGEPLLHPQLVELVEVVRASRIAPRISITTNGLLLERMPDALWEAIDALTISLYPRPALSAASRAAIEERAARAGVALNWKQQDEFVVMTRTSRTDDAAATAVIHDGCWVRERCHMLRAGRFYTCTRPPHLQSYYRGELDFTGDGVALADATADEVHAYLTRTEPLEACAHCFGGSNVTLPHRLLTRDELLPVSPMKRDPFGFTRLYYTAEREGSTVRALLGSDRTLDATAVDAFLAGRVETSRTCFAAVRAVPPGCELVRGSVRPWQPRVEAGDLGGALRVATARIVDAAPRPLAVALSGGLDSAIVLALVRELEPKVTPLVLVPRIAGYSELDTALETARVAGATATVIDVTAEDFRAAVPLAIAAFETPLYNLHPVSKWVLADRARAAGFAGVISGDGADQVFTRDVTADYLPLTSAAFAAAGVALFTPFLDDDVIARVLAVPPDPEKRALRELGTTLAIPPALVRERKVSRLAPPMSLGVPGAKLRDLATLIGRDLPASPDVRWETLVLVVDAFEAWR